MTWEELAKEMAKGKYATATEIIEKQIQMEDTWKAKLDRLAEEVVKKQLEDALKNASKMKEMQAYLDDLLKQNPGWNSERIKEIAKVLLKLYPKLDGCENYIFTAPVVFDIASQISKLLDKEVPEAFK